MWAAYLPRSQNRSDLFVAAAPVLPPVLAPWQIQKQVCCLYLGIFLPGEQHLL